MNPGLFVSLPMAGRKLSEIEDEMQACLAKARSMTGVKYDLVDSICPFETDSPVYALGYAVCALSFAQAAYFAPGWREYRGCQIERAICEKYGIRVIAE